MKKYERAVFFVVALAAIHPDMILSIVATVLIVAGLFFCKKTAQKNTPAAAAL